MESTTLKKIKKYSVLTFKLVFVSLAIIYLIWQIATFFLPFDTVLNFTSQLTGIAVGNLTLPIPNDPALQNTRDFIYASTYGAFFIISIISAIIGTIVLSRGRSFFDAVGIFAVFALPRKRDYTATVLDSASFRPISFATIYVVSKENGKDKVLLSTISDLNGQYKIYLKVLESDLFLQAKVSGYEMYEAPLSNLYENNVIQDVLMKSKTSKESGLKSYYYSIRPKLFKGLIYYIYVLSLLFVIFNVIGFFFYGYNFTLIFLMIIYGSALIWNTFNLYEVSNFKPGRVLDLYSDNVVQGVIIKIYNEVKQFQSTLTLEDGIIRADLDEGVYKVQASKKGYVMVSKNGNQIDFDEMLINQQGYLARNVYMKPIVENSSGDANLQNPFS